MQCIGVHGSAVRAADELHPMFGFGALLALDIIVFVV
jgi:hypothetical protein